MLRINQKEKFTAEFRDFIGSIPAVVVQVTCPAGVNAAAITTDELLPCAVVGVGHAPLPITG